MTDEQRQNWIQKIQEIFQTLPLSRIVNCDKTAWILDPNGMLAWAERGSEPIQTKSNHNEKDGMTVLASMTAFGAKIPLVFIAAGKMGRLKHSQIGNVEGHWRTHSISG
jgi:hypothetical protein